MNRLKTQGVPKEATRFVRRVKGDFGRKLPSILKKDKLKPVQKAKIKCDFLRAGVPWPWEKPQIPHMSYFVPITGRKADFRPRAKAERIADAMAAMPDLVAQFRESRRQRAMQQLEQKRVEKERVRIYQAAAKRLTDMRDLVEQYDSLDDAWFDASDNYYRMAFAPGNQPPEQLQVTAAGDAGSGAGGGSQGGTGFSGAGAGSHSGSGRRGGKAEGSDGRDTTRSLRDTYGATMNVVDTSDVEVLARETSRSEARAQGLTLQPPIEEEEPEDTKDATSGGGEAGSQEGVPRSGVLPPPVDDLVDPWTEGGGYHRPTRVQKPIRRNRMARSERKRLLQKKLQESLRRKPLTGPDMERRIDRSKEMMDPFDRKDGWDDGRTWEKRRTPEEYAFLQQLANQQEIVDPLKNPRD